MMYSDGQISCGAFQLRWQFLPPLSSRALMCMCEGDFPAMMGCPYWREVFVQERISEGLEKIANIIRNAKEDKIRITSMVMKH